MLNFVRFLSVDFWLKIVVYELRKQTAAIAVNSPLLDVSTPHRYSTTCKAITLHGGQRSSQNKFLLCIVLAFRTEILKPKQKSENARDNSPQMDIRH